MVAIVARYSLGDSSKAKISGHKKHIDLILTLDICQKSKKLF